MAEELSVRQVPGQLATASATPSILDILNTAVQNGMAPESLEKLVALHERMEANAARKAFVQAMAAFQASCPPVPRRTENNQFFVTRNGVRKPRTYASLEDIKLTVRQPLAQNGLSYGWSDATLNGGQMTVSCVVSHVDGHSQSSSSTVPTASSAGCSEVQKMGIAQTYAMRYSLILALGLTSCDEDADGNDEVPVDTITEHQAANLEAALDGIPNANKAAFLKWLQVDSFAKIPASMYAQALAAIERKRREAM